jgi:hydroxymethylpyrimidine/phosphomethylpyrimidine kinase
LACLSDIGADAIKTGMLGTAAVVEAVAQILDQAGDIFTVIDPVMIAKGGHSLLNTSAIEAMKTLLVPKASLLTPNIPEAEALTGLSISSEADLVRVGEALLRMGARAVLMKGGHAEGPQVVDLLLTKDGAYRFVAPRLETRHTHGTGCTLASACATLCEVHDLNKGVERAHAYVQGAIKHAPRFGGGHGPLNHSWQLDTSINPI